VILHTLVERKGTEALSARIPFFTCVRPDVFGQPVPPGERLGAQMALEWFLTRVSARVLD